jgi:hypothetical protein
MTEKISAADYNASLAKAPAKKRVMGAVPTEFNGIKFHSKKEAKRYGELMLLEQAGEISNLDRQVRFPLIGRDGPILTPTGRQKYYVADFYYVDWSLNGIWVIEDAKGYQTDISEIKCAIMAAQGQPVTLS